MCFSLNLLLCVGGFLLTAGLGSCTNSEVRECKNIRQGAIESFGGYSKDEPDDLTKAAIRRIQSCEPTFKYGGFDQPMSFERIVKDRHGRRTLIFGMMYVADAKRAHVLDDHGRVTTSYVTGW
jgi:hypothetical protein